MTIGSRELKLFLMLAAALVLVLPAPASFATQKARFNPDGSFWIMGDAPKHFADFAGFNLNASRNKRLPNPGVELTNGTRLRFKTLAVSRDALTFTTVTVGGVSYSFKGTFLEGGTFAARDLMDKPVLEGKLKKFKGGQEVADSKLAFTYFGGT
jgi:hypothetical protein